MQSSKEFRSGVFIDGSNLMWGSLRMEKSKRWFVDFTKFKAHLENEYRPLFFQYYGIVDTMPRTVRLRSRAQAQVRLYAKMQAMGYEVVTKPLKYIKCDDGTFTTKGDMDVELTMGILKALNNLDRIILVSGDSDYLAPVKLVQSQGKSVVILSFQKLLSWELRYFAVKNERCDYKTLESLRGQIEYA